MPFVRGLCSVYINYLGQLKSLGFRYGKIHNKDYKIVVVQFMIIVFHLTVVESLYLFEYLATKRFQNF